MMVRRFRPEQSIRKHGFLSPVIEECVELMRSDNAAWFALAEEVSDFSQNVMLNGISDGAREQMMSPKGIGTRLFVRTISSFQASLKLSERGMTVEAKTLVRSCYETTLLIAGLHLIPEKLISHIRADENGSQLARLKLVLAEIEACSVAEIEFVAKAHQRISELEKISKSKKFVKLKLEKIASDVGLRGVYLFWRQISSGSAHASLSSLDKHVWMENGESQGFQLGPDIEGISESVQLACNATLTAIGCYSDLMGFDVVVAPTLRRLQADFMRLSGITIAAE